MKALSLPSKEVISHGDLWADTGGSSPAPCGQSRVCDVAGARGDICDVAGGNGETSVLGWAREVREREREREVVSIMRLTCNCVETE